MTVPFTPQPAPWDCQCGEGRNSALVEECPVCHAKRPYEYTAPIPVLAVPADYPQPGESMEDYALRYTPRSFRKWSELRVANTAFGAVSFLALEAIGGAIALNYGFTNALWAILTVGLQAAWLLIRTPLVVRVTPAGPRVERAGAPPKNPFSPANALLSCLVKAALASKRRTSWWDT